ncbi:TonB system transport protein ExbD [Phaeovulum sp. NW3]|uniref:TonB system transport protein ExbD n=1 Tax=Phaeovulum sp. NW3 TaxID=2934933 RepID=UPI0020224906|nr:TonB system transport protein ExbD [Phaeovulum sp. NW3]MCL7465308.1 TonB system transport protein ExbD [Phaeovulum sp. NW3]
MAARLSSGADDDLAANTDINITPFIDVMLVLLIIFMVAAPLSTVDVPVELPVATATPAPRPDAPVIVTVQSDLSLLVGDLPIALDALPMELDIATGLKRDTRIYISADRAVPYGEVMAVMNRMRGTGYLKIGLVGLEEDPATTEGAAP